MSKLENIILSILNTIQHNGIIFVAVGIVMIMSTNIVYTFKKLEGNK